jgi:hypothetical protein
VLLACEPRQQAHHDPARGPGVKVAATDAAHAPDSTPAQPFALIRCRPAVLGRAFRGAVILCITFQAASITSVALDDLTRNGEARAALETLVEQALAPDARHGFPRNSVLYRGLLALVLAAVERITPNNTHSAQFDALVSSLATDLEVGWLPSYEGETYPCDHAPALSALRLHAVLRLASRRR